MKLSMGWAYTCGNFILAVLLCVGVAQVVDAQAITLPIEEAIRRAIETNLTTRLAQAVSVEARGRAIQAAASLLPQITGSVYQSRVFKTNLAAQGMTGNLFPNSVVGPYDVFDARVELVQKLLDVNSIWNRRAAAANVQVAKLEENLAAEQVASATALAYIEDLRAIHAVQDAQANLELAQKLSTLAHHQHEAGLATAVDLARADTRVAQFRQMLIQTQLGATQADIRLKRVIGLPLADVVSVSTFRSETLSAGPQELSAIAQAQSDRVELRITDEQVKVVSDELSAAKANYLPTLSAEADYGFSANTPSDNSARTGQIAGRLDLPIFNGGLTHGQVMEAKGRKLAAQSQYADTRIQVEEDVRLALHTLAAEVDDANASETQVQLAEKELQLAQDRYSSGVGDNIQVVTAQTSLADARRSRVDARARYADAHANLAMALGHMQTFQL